jgi:hypothetical protein
MTNLAVAKPYKKPLGNNEWDMVDLCHKFAALYEEAAACRSGHDYTYTASAVFAAAR